MKTDYTANVPGVGECPVYYRNVDVKIRRFRDRAIMPEKKTTKAAGYDIFAWVEEDKDVFLNPGHSMIIKTGLNLRLPPGYQAAIRTRSGLAAKNKVFVLNSPGTVDEDYNGDGEDFELKIILFNAGHAGFTVNHGDRIAQMVIEAVIPTTLTEDLGENTNRGDVNRVGGFGSTGVG